jgi:hypothetical protein
LKHIIFVRGLPGSGKTTLATRLAQKCNSKFFEADQFMVDQHGNYKFDIRKLGYAHKQCLIDGLKYLARNQTVIFSNTFVTIRDFVPYIREIQNFKSINLTANNFVANSNNSIIELRENCGDPISVRTIWRPSEPPITDTDLTTYPKVEPNLDNIKITIYQPGYHGTSVHNVPEQTMENYRRKWIPTTTITQHFKRNLKKADIQYNIL